MAFVMIAMIVALSRDADSSPPPRAVVVVVAKGSKIKSLTRAELRRCFSGDALVVHHARMIPFNSPPGSAERIAFDRFVLGMSPDQVGRLWVDRKIRGQSPAPRSLPSALHTTKIVAKFPSAISYVRVDHITADVDVVAIDGVLPTSSGYPILIEEAR
ncbi:MAG: hypothetical protein H0T42_03935 [Deltaproteobacteria bacterium]|nr:hypothetical protein [Deltaproteobacteria bacterium]